MTGHRTDSSQWEEAAPLLSETRDADHGLGCPEEVYVDRTVTVMYVLRWRCDINKWGARCKNKHVVIVVCVQPHLLTSAVILRIKSA
jgi:hypothetical protein